MILLSRKGALKSENYSTKPAMGMNDNICKVKAMTSTSDLSPINQRDWTVHLKCSTNIWRGGRNMVPLIIPSPNIWH